MGSKVVGLPYFPGGLVEFWNVDDRPRDCFTTFNENFDFKLQTPPSWTQIKSQLKSCKARSSWFRSKYTSRKLLAALAVHLLNTHIQFLKVFAAELCRCIFLWWKERVPSYLQDSAKIWIIGIKPERLWKTYDSRTARSKLIHFAN